MADTDIRERGRRLQSLGGRIGAFRVQATHDLRELTGPARLAFLSKFEFEVDPEGILPEEERRRRAEAARRAHFARLSFLAVQARSGRKNGKRNGGTTTTVEPPSAGEDTPAHGKPV